MTQAKAAYGTQLKRNGTICPELKNLSDVGGSLATVDVTAHDGAGWVERIATLLDGGAVRADFNFVPGNAQHVGLRTDMAGKVLQNFSVVLPTSGNPTWTFSAFVSSYKTSAPVAGDLPLAVMLEISGSVTFA